MVESLQIVGISAGSLIFLIGLFAIEDRRGSRYIGRFRDYLDRLVDALIVRWHKMMLYVGGGAGRVWLHYVFHQMLGWFVRILRVAESSARTLQKKNRKMVKTVQTTRTESHLSAIAAHQKATALSPTEKKHLKEKSLTG